MKKNYLIYKNKFCPICKKYSQFMNIGDSKKEFICLFCKSKTDFRKHELIVNKFGYYWRKRNSIQN